MKKFIIAVGLGLMAGSLYAACNGPFCWDDQGAYVGGTINDGNGTGTAIKTRAQIQAATPRAAGQEVWCTDCNSFNGGTGMLCISTGTTVYGYMAVSTATAVSGCK